MKKILGLSILVLACAPAFAQDMTARQSNAGKTVLGGGVMTDAVCFYGGDFDGRNGLTSERNTLVTDSWTYDDFTWAGGTISTAFSCYLDTGIGTPTGGDLIVYSGLSNGVQGTLMGQATGVSSTVAPTGRSGFGLPEQKISLTLGGQAFALAAGTYHLGIRPVGNGSGQAYVSTTSGANSVGAPIANGNVFLQSAFFGFPLPTDWQSLLGAGNWDVSMGVDCGGGGGYTLTLSGVCPGTVRVAWSGAPANTTQGIVFGNNLGSTTIPSGPCQGLVLGIQGGVTLVNTLSTGNGSGAINGNAGSAACGHFLQLVAVGNPCTKSNVAQIP